MKNRSYRVLFVASGNSENFDIVPFIKIQGDSLVNMGIDVDYFPVRGKGIIGYIKAGLQLRRILKNKSYALIHAHYTLSGWTAVLGHRKHPVLLSLMGSDAYGDFIGVGKIKITSIFNIFLSLLIQPFVKVIISKSKNIEKFVYLKSKSVVLPNGVDIELFRYLNNNSKNELGLNENKNYILFLGNKENIRKNYKLVLDAIHLLDNTNIEILNPYPISHNDIPKYMNAANLLVLTSYAEGSPNVVKEAMACNMPIVSTDVGDVRWLLGDLPGHFITSYDPKDMAEKLKLALKFSVEKKRTDGRSRILELGLDSESIAKKLVSLYYRILE